MNALSLHGQRVLVLGLGLSGLSLARWCAQHGAEVRVWDSREAPPQAQALHAQWPDVPVLSGAVPELGDTQRIFKSPGLSPLDAQLAPLLQAAQQAGVLVQGELALFNEALAALREERGYQPKVLAITGTNGKTTTTALTALLVERAGHTVAVAGNIGPTLLETLAERLQSEDPLPEVWVLELSSFQLDGVQGFAPDAAAVLNLSQDHLDWHGSMADYVAAKARIFGPETHMVLNRDDAPVLAMLPAPVAVKGARGKAAKTTQRAHTLLSLNEPLGAGDFGLVEEGGMTWLVRAQPGDETLKRQGAADEPLYIQRLMPADALRIRGRHNAANALAALALASAIGCTLAPMLHGLREYRGEPHRVQPVGLIQGVEAYDDSKGTNVGATVAALLGLGADKSPGKLVVILGGDDKGQDFTPLAAPVAQHARAVALIGRDAALIEQALQGCNLPMQHHSTLEAATAWCFTQAQSGDAVLLSPACASLDMFRNYGHRAEVFVAAVQAWAAEQGEVMA